MAEKERAGGGRADGGSDDQARPMKLQAEACDTENRGLNQDEERNQGEKSRDDHRRGYHSMSLPGEGGSAQNRKRRRRSKPGPDFPEHRSMRSPATSRAIARISSPTNRRCWWPRRGQIRP